MDILCKFDWTHTHDIGHNEEIVEKWIFTPTTFTSKGYYQDNTSHVVFTYYLSDQIETTFDDNKVGKIPNGRYIITKNKFSEVFVTEIISVSETEFEFISLPKEPNTRAQSSSDRSTTTFTAIPKQ